ncbi:Pectate lyase superfamily protein [Aquisphaera giovannonii]|uniref:Pectate lyase superfamily protein n=1 Tax=Aquisphaera giovannonii TaxID=406548 RepID=A0A5B9WBQ6_9BACT|nr:right-handed parallel beta-helix repeat-containing protein [Aquisphaera giovannonii]QEH37465.1 Pectate lyase superfamily protein [Aquisphaera giovannonii]
MTGRAAPSPRVPGPERAPSRRRFLGASLAGSAALLSGRRGFAMADDAPAQSPGDGPRAISGDHSEPDWKERYTLTVGARGGDLVGTTEKALQAAVDQVAARGGGTVRILPGTYRLRNAVYLPSGVRLLGSGAESVLIKEPSVRARLAASADWYDREITLADARGFRVGDGVCLRAKNPNTGGPVVIKRTLVARDGNRFQLDRALRDNLWLEKGEPTAATLFPLLSLEDASGVTIEDLALDGNRGANENLDGNYAGCIFAQDCSRLTFRRVLARNNNGDGLSWQICHDVLVQDCVSEDHAGLGLHPGSGSQRPIIRGNAVRRCEIGIFFCWGVRFGLAERNTIEDIRTAGVSLGHRDTDNVVRDNAIVRSGRVGVLFRDERREFAAHRNRIENNRIADSGPADGIGIDVQGQTEGVAITGNEIRESRGPASRIGIRVGTSAKDVTLAGNRIEGFGRDLADQRGT